MLEVILLVAGAICLLLATIGVTTRINLTSLGLLLWLLATALIPALS